MRISWAIVTVLLLGGALLVAGDEEKLRKFLGDKVPDGWIYEDVEAGYKQALATGKPLLVSFRCVP